MDQALIAQVPLVVVHVADLGRDGHAFAVLGAPLTVVFQRLQCRGEQPDIQHIASNQQACATLAGLAVNDCYVLSVRIEPVVNVAAEVVDQIEDAWIVIQEAIFRNAPIEI